MAKGRPSLELPLSDSFLRAIGRVITLWAFLEVEFDGCLKAILQDPEASALAPAYPRSFKKRAALLKAAARSCFGHHLPTVKWLERIAEDADRLRDSRDFIAHGRWTQHMTGRRWKQKPSGKMVTVLVQEGDWGRNRAKQLSLAGTDRIADDIGELCVRIAWLWNPLAGHGRIPAEIKSQLLVFQRRHQTVLPSPKIQLPK
jgi:hypothetical protein